MSDPKHLTRRELLSSLTALGLIGLPAVASAAAGLVVVVNAANAEALGLPEVAAIFTTRRQAWKSGERIVPFNYPPRHEVRAEFDQVALGMDPDAAARYWIDRKIRGGNAPPKQVNSGQLIVRLVAKMPGGVGYVPRALVTPDVRIAAEI